MSSRLLLFIVICIICIPQSALGLTLSTGTTTQTRYVPTKFFVKKVPTSAKFDLSSDKNKLPISILVKEFDINPALVSFCKTIVDQNNIEVTETDCQPLYTYNSIKTVLKHGDLSLAPLNEDSAFWTNILAGKKVKAKLKFELLNVLTTDYSLGYTRKAHPEYLLAHSDTGLFNMFASDLNANPKEQQILPINSDNSLESVSTKNNKINIDIQTKMSTLRAQAEISASNLNPSYTSFSYEKICTDKDVNIILSEINKINKSGKIYCKSSINEYIIAVELLESKKVKCIDSTGQSIFLKKFPKKDTHCVDESL